LFFLNGMYKGRSPFFTSIWDHILFVVFPSESYANLRIQLLYILTWNLKKQNSFEMDGWKWMFPKIVVPPNHPFLVGFSLINHPFWGVSPIFWKHPNGDSQRGLSEIMQSCNFNDMTSWKVDVLLKSKRPFAMMKNPI